MKTLFLLFIIIGLFMLIFLPILQIYLSLKEDKRLGLILPGTIVSLSIIVPIIINLWIVNVLRIIILYVIIANIATVIYLIIYLICRSVVNKRGSRPPSQSINENQEINKMKIDDLG